MRLTTLKQYIAYKYKLKPTTEQRSLLLKTFGCCRKVYNLMLADKISHYKLTGLNLKATPAKYKSLFPFLKEVDSLALCNEQLNLEQAYKNFFKNKHCGFPKFKSKKTDRNSYTTNFVNNNIVLTNTAIKLPKIGLIKAKIHRTAPADYILKSVTVSMESDNKFYVSVLYEYESQDTKPIINNHIGLDYKSDGLYVDSNNICINMPKFYKLSEEKLAKEQRKLSRKTKGSNSYLKQKLKIAKLHKHIANQRKDFLHKLSNEITNRYDLISVEDLNLSAMKQQCHFGKAVSDNAYAMFLSMLQYKQQMKHHMFIQVDRFFASSQLCFYCGYKNNITKGLAGLNVRTIHCPNCNSIYDRDHNAAMNIDSEGYHIALLT